MRRKSMVMEQPHIYIYRIIFDQGKIHYSFVMGKSHLRPLKNAATVPRLELTAATLATLVVYAITKVR